MFDETILMRKVKQNDIQSVSYLLKQGANIEAADYYDKTPILYAALNGNIEMVKLLMSYGADLTPPYAPGNALSYAVDGGNLELVKYLITMGMDPNGRYKTPIFVRDGERVHAYYVERSILYNAIFHNEYQMAALLLTNGAKINQESDSEVIQLARTLNNRNVIELLEKHGAIFPALSTSIPDSIVIGTTNRREK